MEYKPQTKGQIMAKTRYMTETEAIELLSKGVAKGNWRYTIQMLIVSGGISLFTLAGLTGYGFYVNAKNKTDEPK